MCEQNQRKSVMALVRHGSLLTPEHSSLMNCWWSALCTSFKHFTPFLMATGLLDGRSLSFICN